MGEQSPVLAKRPTIVDVARHAGVSTAAASKVLRNAYGVSPDMKAKVEAAMDALGYRPLAHARAMRGRTYTVAVLIPDLHNTFSHVLIDGIKDEAEKLGYKLLVAPAGGGKPAQGRMIDALIDRRMDGLVLISPLGADTELEAIARTIPLVVLGRHGDSRQFDTVASDDLAGSALIIDHLADLGHRRIAYIDHVTDRANDARLPEEVRLQGYVDAMTRRGLEADIDVVDSDWSQEGGEAAGRRILSRTTRPTAIHAGADVAALGALTAFWGAGVAVPEQISVVGYDNTFTSSLDPISLTTVDQSGFSLGTTAGRLLVERIEGRKDPVSILVEPSLIVRKTTAPPRG